MPEENFDNAYFRLFIQFLIKFGITDLSQIKLEKSSLPTFTKNLAPNLSEIQMIQTLIARSHTNSIDSLKLKYLLKKNTLELPTLFEITASFIKSHNNLKQDANNPSKVGEIVSEKFIAAKDATVNFLESPFTNAEVDMALNGIINAPYFYKILFLLSNCFSNDSKEIKKF